MKQPTPDEISAFDLRRTCHHEAAHYVIAERFGAEAYVIIERNEAGSSDPNGERMWKGQCALRTCGLDERETRIFGLAGEVAAWLLDDSECDVDTIWYDGIELGIIDFSPTDEVAIEGFTYADLDECVELVRNEWDSIREFAEQMIEKYTHNPRVVTPPPAG